MVTWGVTDAGGRHASAGSEGVDAGEDAVGSPTNRRPPPVAGAPPESAESDEHPPDGGLPPITVEPTPAGVATALSHAGAGLTTTEPRRSHPAYRRGPPPIAVGDRTRVPARVRAATPEVDITLEVPASLSALFVVAPLAYYLPATVEVSDDAPSRLVVDGETCTTLTDPEDDVPSILRRAFHLDCLVRDGPPGVGPRGRDGDAAKLLGTLDRDADAIRDLAPEARLDRYLAARDGDDEKLLPDWHLSTAVDPTPDAISCLPPLVERLSLIHRPKGEPREHSALLDRTLSSAYRTRGHGGSSDVLSPSAPAGRSHGWLAPGKPLDAFKPTGSAFEHRRRFDVDRSGSLSVAVVLGDGRMTDEQEQVASVYRDRADDASLSVDVARAPTRATLREVFGRGYDFVHYIGHCDDGGLRCVDGHLAAADLESCRAPTFFLNACGSYDEGLALVDRGAVAGAVTFADVLDRHAARVGTTFARLLVSGFSVQRALELARRRILMGQDYAVVGDGTYAPWAAERPPGVLTVEPAEVERDGAREQAESPEEFDVTYEVVTVRATGERHPDPFGTGDLLNGEAVTRTLSRASLLDLLGERSVPVVYEDDLLWTADLCERLGG